MITCKIAAKSIANRIKTVLPDIINNDQTGFIKGRFTGENIRLIDSVIGFAKERNIPGLLLVLDFEKAFDTIEWPFIRKTLRYFGFGDGVINWMNIFYGNVESCVLKNGWASNFFEIQRGVRQGCPLSPYLFVLTVEVLAKAIRENKNIKGILVNQNEIKISQYADDMTLILDGSKSSLEASLKILDKFGAVSGLRLNDKKTEALWIGSNTGKDQIIFSERNFKWPKYKVKSLGVWISVDPEATIMLNYNERLAKVRNVLNCWKYRRLTLIGKITVLKSLATSQLVYMLSPLRTDVNAIKEANKIFYTFLWNGKGDKIKRDVMINDYPNGGLKMIDIQSFSKSLKVTWIKKYLDTENQGKWKLFFDLELGTLGGKIALTGNLNKKDTTSTAKASNSFIKEVLTIWSEANFEDNIISEKQFLDQCLWYNSLIIIRIDNRPIFYKEWSNKGIKKVKHLKDDLNNFLSLDELRTKYNINACPLRYYGLISAIKSTWNTHKCNFVNNSPEYENFSTKLMSTQSATRLAYSKLVADKPTAPTQSQQKWMNDCEITNAEDIKWQETYQLAWKCTKSTRLKEFQFKFLHRRISTNDFLFIIGIKDDPKCSFCREAPEKLLHLFWKCPKTESFWTDMTSRLTQCKIIPNNNSLECTVAMGLTPDSSQYHYQINFCCLLARHFIWLCHTKETIPHIDGFRRYLKLTYETEQISKTTTLKKWELLNNFI